MKKYIDYMQEITKDELRKGLLGYGLFADKLPSIFSAESFYDYCKNNKFSNFEKKERDYVRYESTRNTNIPRQLSIPSPFAYSNLCNCIVDNWDKIINHFKQKTDTQEYKLSQIHIQKLKGKASLFEMNHGYSDKDKELVNHLQTIPITNRFRVDADISSCFPSIYSHVLSWALVGKDEAKNNKIKKTKWYNKLDYHSRNIKNGETNGLLIGPHSSNLLSEIVLCSIDNELFPKYKYIRNIDDFTCYVESEDKAEHFILDLEQTLKKYELGLNAKKTNISKLPLSSDTDWIRSLNGFFIGDTYTADKKIVFKKQRLKAYLDLAIKLANETGNSAVYTYAVKTIASTYLGERAQKYYINQVHQLLCLYPYLVHWMEDYIFDYFNVEKEQIMLMSNSLYTVGLSRHIYEACSFSLYWSLKYDFPLTCDHVNESIKSSDCVFMLLSYLKVKKDGDNDGATKLVEFAKSLISDIDRYWIFVFEALSENDLPEGEYRALKKNKISFIKPEYT